MRSQLFSRPFLVRLDISVEARIESAKAGAIIRDMRTGIAPGVIVVSIGVWPVLFASRTVALGLKAVVAVPQVEFVPVVVVGARMPGRAIKPRPATTPSIATRVNLAREPTFKPRSALVWPNLL